MPCESAITHRKANIKHHPKKAQSRHGTEPRLGGLAVRTDQQNVEWRVIGLPDGIRPRSFSPVNQLKRVAVRLRAFVSERYKICTQIADDAEYGTVARSLLAQVHGQALHMP